MKKIIKSFEPKKELNPKIWDNNDRSSPTLKPEIRERLLATANSFIDFLELDLFIDDAVITGSICNYTWSEYSDIDIHLIIDISQFPEDIQELYKKIFSLKRLLFNKDYDIKIKNFDVEVYAQDRSEKHESPAIFSLVKDEWVKFPKKESLIVNPKDVGDKANNLMKYIDSILNNYEDDDLESIKKITSKVKEKLSKYRKSGLQKNGELSFENLVYKILRRKGYLDKLYDFDKKIAGKRFTVEQHSW